MAFPQQLTKVLSQAVYRVLFRLGADRAHFPRASMEALFTDKVKKRAYPLNRPGT